MLAYSEIQRNKNDFAAFEYEIDLELCYFLPENRGRKRCFCYSFINVYKEALSSSQLKCESLFFVLLHQNCSNNYQLLISDASTIYIVIPIFVNCKCKDNHWCFDSFNSLTWSNAANYAFKGPGYPTWNAVLGWSLDGTSANPGIHSH